MPRVLLSCLSLVDTALELVFQPVCAGCGTFSGNRLCPQCGDFRVIEGPLCDTCGEPTSQGMTECGRCWGRRRPWKLRSMLWLTEGPREVLHKVKYSGRFELLSLFRPAFDALSEGFFEGLPTVFPVPLHPRRSRERGFNQSELLSQWLCHRFGLPHGNGLRKVGPTAAQSTLSRVNRLRNLRRSFAWRGKGPPPETALLVDDVLTTGATMAAAATALKRAGAKRVYAWTLFRTPHSLFGPLSS